MRQIIQLSETLVAADMDAVLHHAARDLWQDWEQLDGDEWQDEPEPRRSVYAAAVANGIGLEHSDQQRFLNFIVPTLRAEANRLINGLAWHNGTLEILRQIMVEGPRTWVAAPRQPLGVFWATAATFNYIFQGPRDHRLTMKSRVRSEQIDWRIVVLKHLTYSENEIRVKDGELVPLLEIETNEAGGTHYDVTHLQGKLFSVGERGDDWLD